MNTLTLQMYREILYGAFIFFMLIIHEQIFYLNHYKLLPLVFNWILLTCIYC